MLKTIYLIHHSHTDLGYTHPQPVVRHLHCRYIDSALREIERTRHYPAGARMKWTCETLYPVFDWLRQASPASLEHFAALEKEGFIEVAACWEIITQSSPPRAWQWMMDRVQEARSKYGFTIRSAMLSDINGAPWAMPDLLASHGITNFSMSINEHFGKSIFPRQMPFRWRGPNGGVLNVFNGFHYNNNQYFGIPYDLERGARGVEEIQQFLGRYPGFDLDFAVFQVTRPDFNDNGSPDPRLPDFVRAWNAAGSSPRMEIVTLSEFFEAIGKECFQSAPEHSGEWTDFWNFGAASTPYETGLNRRAYRVTEEVESLIDGQSGTTEILGFIESAMESAVFHDEHTWGADGSISAPDCDASRAGLHYKNDFAYRAHDTALLARAEALALRIGQAAPPEPGQHVLVANPCSFPVRSEVEIPVNWLLSDVCPTPTHLHRMQHEPVSWPPATIPISARELPAAYGGNSHVRFALDLKAHEVRSYSADHVFSIGAPSSVSVRGCPLTDARLENDFFSVRLDATTGGLAFLVDKSTGWNLLSESGFPSGVPLWEAPIGRNRREIHPTPDWTKFMGYKGWNSQWEAVRESPAPAAECSLTSSKGRTSLHQTFTSPRARSISVGITLDQSLEAVGFEISIDFRKTSDPCAWYWPMHFGLQDPVFTYDNCGIPVQLGRDQLPGANMDYQTVHRWIRVSDHTRSALLFPLDTPLACLGGLNFGRMTNAQTPRKAIAAAMLQCNYWDTNYAAFCDGLITFRFFIAPGDRAKSAVDADALASRLAHPPLIVPFAGPQRSSF